MPDVIAESAVAGADDGKADDTGFLDDGGASISAGGSDESSAMHARVIASEFSDFTYIVLRNPSEPLGNSA
jgi:hypothetical protein